MIRKPLRLMEYLWLFLTVLNGGLFIFESFRSGLKNSYVFLIFAVISFLMYLARKTIRQKEEEETQ